MKKYYFIIKTELQRQLTYRVDIYAYRLSNLLELFALLFVWMIAYKNTSMISGYSQPEMITYVLVGWLFMYIARNYGLSDRIADDIFEGRVSDFLIKPVSYLKYMTVLSFGRSSISLVSSIIIQAGVIVAFSKYIIFNLDLSRAIILLLILGVSYFINLFLSFITGMIAFWTQRILGIDYTISMAVRVLSGAYFPIALLPALFLKIDKFFPFIYTIYMPTQLYLGKISLKEGIIGLGVEVIWLFLLYGIIKITWKRGLKRYEGVGI